MIRDVHPADLARVLELAAVLSAHEGSPPPATREPTLARELFDPGGVLSGLVATRDRAVIGYALWTTGFDVQLGTRVPTIVDLCVDPPERRRGIAASLIAHVAAWTRSEGHAALLVTTYELNSESNAFYAAMGAQRDRVNQYYWAGDALRKLASSGGPGSA